MTLTLTIAFLALFIERFAGYPGWLFARIGHPVTWMGALISRLDKSWNRETESFAQRRFAGVTALFVLLGTTITLALIMEQMLFALPFGLLVTALVAASLPAQKSLEEHVAAVASALETGGVEAGRRAVSMIVGRDPEQLDEAAICRAAIESLAENFSDGIAAPAVWLGLGGLVSGAAYKAINTADSMIGHKSPRHQAFGWAAARIDDLVNLPASRLSGLLFLAAALVLPGASALNGWRAIRRDAHHHRSPNAGWPESALAGALGFALAGPRSYGGQMIEASFMGEGGRRDLTPADIRRALTLMRIASWLMIGLFGALALVSVPV